MAKSPRTTKVRSLNTRHPPRRRQGKQTGTEELVLTLSSSEGEVVKVEMLGKSGQRRELSDEEFAELPGEDEEETSPEEAYAASIADASEEDEFEFDEEGGADEEKLERYILREIVARQLLRRGVRQFILRRRRRRQMIRSQGRSKGKAAPGAGYTSHKNGHEGTGETG